LKPDVKTVVTSLTPKFEGEYARRFDQLCKALNRRDPTGRDETLRAARISSEVAWASEMTMNRVESQRYLTAVLILSDLLNLRWELDYSPTGLELVAPPFPDARGLTTEGIQKLKSDLRNELAPAVRKQLEHPATVDFIRRMEQPHQQAKHQSIRLLIADGTELVNRLQNVVALTEAEQENALSVAVRPYLQLVNSEQRDQFTGIRLGDVWRYFRHTWSIPSMSIPGRQLLYLVRDAAHPNHSVMGIAALSNAAMQLGVRDVYIGWTTANFRGHFLDVIQRQDLSTCSYLIDILERYIETGIEEIDWQGLVEPHEVIEPSETVVNRLRTQVSIFAKERQSELKRSNSDINGDLGEIEEEIFELADVEDEALQPDVSKEILALDEKGYEAKIGDARRQLIFKKRAFELSRLLSARLVFQSLRRTPNLLDAIDVMLNRDEFLVAVNSALVAHKKRRIGTNMLEITTCGAIPPYNEILGGKLVALLMLSPQIIADYHRRYGDRPSLIASQLRNLPVIRSSELVYLGTTSLYGLGSSQYNRLRLPAGLLHPDQPELRYREIGHTSGFGTVQFSSDTSRALAKMDEYLYGFQDVNHIFGEGFSPKLRKIRAGLSNLGFDSDVILRHNQPRILYAIELCTEARAFLLGEPTVLPEYIANPSNTEEATECIAQFWRQRWLHSRIQKPSVLNALRDYQWQSIQHRMITGEIHVKPMMQTQVKDMVAVKIPDPRVAGVSVEFLQKLYRDTSAYSDRLQRDQREAIHITTRLEGYVLSKLEAGYSIILTGNAGDGKTHILTGLLDAIAYTGARVILDASAVKSRQIIQEWQNALQAGVPFCMATNEWPLYTLIREFSNELPILEHVQQQLDQQLIYDEIHSVLAIDDSRLIVIDLGKRNHLQNEFFGAALEAMLREALYEQCPRCPVFNYCDTTRNRHLLRNEQIAARLSELISRIAVMGYHVTVRELLAMISYIIFGGRTCRALARYSGKRNGLYSDQLFDPNAHGEIFDLLRKYMDPAMISHPMWDSRLYYNDHTSSDWVDSTVIETIYSDKRVEFEEREKKFNHMKRRFYFEHVDGNEVLEMLPEDENIFLRWVDPNNDDLDAVLDDVLEAVNMFFCPVLEPSKMRDRLFIWTSHHFDERVPKAFLCVQTVERRAGEVTVQRPQLASHLREAFDYYPDHIRLTVYPRQENAPYLKIDYALFKTLRDVKRGLPPMLVPEELSVRLYQFMNAVHAISAPNTRNRQETLSYIIGSNTVLETSIRRGKHVVINKQQRSE